MMKFSFLRFGPGLFLSTDIQNVNFALSKRRSLYSQIQKIEDEFSPGILSRPRLAQAVLTQPIGHGLLQWAGLTPQAWAPRPTKAAQRPPYIWGSIT